MGKLINITDKDVIRKINDLYNDNYIGKIEELKQAFNLNYMDAMQLYKMAGTD